MLHNTLLLVFGLLAVIVFVAGLATRLKIPYAVLLLLGGAVISIIPAIPDLRLDPDLILLLFLPPLIYSSAWTTSWRDFRENLFIILLLAIGLVLVTMVFVAAVAHAVIPGLAWPVAFALGAVVSPTDAVAATSATQSMGISRRVVAIIEGESLVNDATALVAFNFAVAAVTTGAFSFGQASLQFVFVVVGGLAIGLLVAWPTAWLHRRLDDPPIEITFGLLTPFVAYLLAEEVGVSGVLAVLTAGLYLGRQSALFYSATTRLQAQAIWNVLVFLFNGFVFLLVGLQLVPVSKDLNNSHPLLPLIGYTLLISVVVIGVRLVWAMTTFFFLHVLHHLSPTRFREVDWRNSLVIGWTGMRGGVSLAAALAIPTLIMQNAPFPDRDQIVFVTFGVILVTLLLQGLSLGPLIRLLGLQADPAEEQEIRRARLAAARAAIARLEELQQEDWVPKDASAHLHKFYTRMMQGAAQADVPLETLRERITPYQRLRQEMLQAERMMVIQLRNDGRINDEVLHRLEREFDLEEERLKRE